ncbi:glycosyltransferase [Paraburkholderia sp. IMGN_8]|uniref:glycosyltransferase n=1 Tax=Paraburkholderia sp. IMGN_8 TaxID=3136564 RepID=UPI0031019F7F
MMRDNTSMVAPGAAPVVARALRVALVVEAAGGGVAVHVADLIQGLISRGVEVHLIAPLGERLDTSILTDRIVGQCASFACVPMQRDVSWRDAIAFFHVFRRLMAIQPDIVHSHSSKAGVLARACVGTWKQIYTPHAFYTLNPYLARGKKRFYGAMERLFGTLRTDRLIAVSTDEARHANDALGLPEQITTIIHNGASVFELLPREEARQALCLDPDAFTVGFVGRFEFQKGVDRLVGVAEVLQERFGDQIRIAVIGMGDVERAAGRSVDRLPSNMHLLGKVVNARRYFPAFDLFVMPSRYEGFPYVYLEAMVAHLPVVTTRVAGADELIAAQQIGLVVDNVDDPSHIADAVGRLFGDQALRTQMSANCGRVMAHFSAAEMVGRTLDVYHDVTMETFR